MLELSANPILFILLFVFILLTLLVVSLIFVNTYTFLGKWFGFLEKERNKDVEQIKEQAYATATDIISKAKATSLEILKESNLKAQETLNSAVTLNEDSKKELYRQLEEMTNKYTELLATTGTELHDFYKNLVTEQKNQSINTLKSASTDIEKELLAEVDEFKDVLKGHTLSVEKTIEEKVAAQYADVEKEIAQYRMEQLRKVDSQIFVMLAEISREVLGRALNLEDHQDLVKQSLEEAKRKLVFKNGTIQ